MTTKYTYTDKIVDSDTLMTELKAGVLTWDVLYINTSPEIRVVEIFYPEELSIPAKAELDLIVETHVPIES